MTTELSRRAFVGTVTAGAAGLVGVVGSGASGLMYARSARADEPAHDHAKGSPSGAGTEGETYYHWTPVSEEELAEARKKTGAVAFGDGGNTLLVHTEAAAVLIDTKNSPFGEVLRNDVGVLSPGEANRPWSTYADRLVVNTHHHPDHTGGNFAFTPVGAVLAHPKAAPRIRDTMDQFRAAARQALADEQLAQLKREGKTHERIVEEHLEPLAEAIMKWKDRDFLPTRMFAPEGGKTDVALLGKPVVEKTRVGDIEFSLHHFGPGHTDNDLVVYLPEWNVLHVGDFVFRRLHPFIDRAAGATIPGWIYGLEESLKLCDAKTVVIPGHGEVTGREGIEEQIRYMRAVWEQVTAWVSKGMTRDEVIKQPLEQFKDYGFAQFRPITLGGMYDEAAELAAKDKLRESLRQ